MKISAFVLMGCKPKVFWFFQVSLVVPGNGSVHVFAGESGLSWLVVPAKLLNQLLK